MNNELTEFEQQNAIFPGKVWKFEIKSLSLHRSNFYGAEDVAPQGGNFYATNFNGKSTAAPRGVWDNHPKVFRRSLNSA